MWPEDRESGRKWQQTGWEGDQGPSQDQDIGIYHTGPRSLSTVYWNWNQTLIQDPNLQWFEQKNLIHIRGCCVEPHGEGKRGTRFNRFSLCRFAGLALSVGKTELSYKASPNRQIFPLSLQGSWSQACPPSCALDGFLIIEYMTTVRCSTPWGLSWLVQQQNWIPGRGFDLVFVRAELFYQASFITTKSHKSDLITLGLKCLWIRQGLWPLMQICLFIMITRPS